MSKTHLFDLDGKIAFVSGASRGIGEAIAKLLAQQGAHVIVSSRKIDDCQKVADAIVARLQPGRRVFVAVGAGHFGGDAGLLAALSGRGFTLRQVEAKDD